MSTNYTNSSNLPLPFAVWLANDEYDHNVNPNVFSATTLLKPVRQTVLSERIEQSTVELSTLLSSRIGTAIHDAIERSWRNPVSLAKGLAVCGYPSSMINKIVVNPTADMSTKGKIPVYLEQRLTKKVGEYYVSGKFDIVINGVLGDIKNTSVFTYINQTNADKYIKQGSIYRWLNPDIITEDYIEIYHQFTDWSALDAKSQKDKGYPQSKLLTVKYPLMSLQETEAFVKNTLSSIAHARLLASENLPECSEEDLWVQPTKFKYYSDPNKTTRATKNFDDLQSATVHKMNAGKGIVIEVKGKVKACNYCSARGICNQYESLQQQGRI